MSPLFKSRRGVSALEYLALAVLLMTGILLGGPYVMRSINAPFKALEEGSLDSTREEIKQGNVNSVPVGPCICLPLSDQGCGDGNACSRTQKVFKRTCAPLGCEVDLIAAGVITVMQECRNEASPPSTCCLDAQSTGNCGILAAHVPGGCPAGHMEMRKMCGSPIAVPVYSCVADPACVNDCQPFSPTYAVGWCDPLRYKDGVVGLTPPVYVDNGHCLDTLDMKCKVECKEEAYSVAGACIPHCPNGICENGLGGTPNYGETNVTCPADCSAAPPACQVYKVTSRFFSTPMNAHAMWPGPADDAHLFLEDNCWFTASLNIAADGNFLVQFGVDNYGWAQIDGVEVCNATSRESTYSWDPLKLCGPVFLTAGIHTVTLAAVNQAGGGGSWGNNAGGVSFQLLDSITNAVVLSSDQLPVWVPTVNGNPNYCNPVPVLPVCGDCACSAGEDVSCATDCDGSCGGGGGGG